MAESTEILLRDANKILLLGAERVGDMLFATPAIKMLRDFRPNAKIDIVVFSKMSKEVISNNPAINQTHLSPNRWQLKKLAIKYDIVVAVHENKEILKHARLLHKVKFYRRDSIRMHMKMYPISFIRELLEEPNLPYPESYQLFPQPKHFDYVKNLLQQKGADLERHTLVCCHMGCKRVAQRGARLFRSRNIGEDTKCWAFSNYAKLAERLEKEQPDLRLILTGTKGEQRIAKEYLSNLANIIDIIGQTSILELAALMKFCHKFLSANTGPLHIASATDIPLVTLIGKHDPDVYGPSPPGPHRIVLRNSSSVDNITVEEVKNALLRV